MTTYIPTMTISILSVVRWSTPDEFAISGEFSHAIVDTVRPFVDATDNDGLNGPSLAPMVLDPHLGSRMKWFLYGFGAMDSFRDS